MLSPLYFLDFYQFLDLLGGSESSDYVYLFPYGFISDYRHKGFSSGFPEAGLIGAVVWSSCWLSLHGDKV